MSATLESQSEQLRSRMASLRLHMNKDARRIVANTNRLFDWQDYVKQFPKTLIAAGLVAGFLLGPGRKVIPSVKLSQDTIDDLLKQRKYQAAVETPQRSEIASGASRMLTGLAISGISILVRQGVENYLKSPAKSNESSADRGVGSNSRDSI